jgi:hypothetical protein
MITCPFCGRPRRIAAVLDAIRFAPPHDPARCHRCSQKLRSVEQTWPLPADAHPKASRGV